MIYVYFISFFTEVTEVMLGIGSAYGDSVFQGDSQDFQKFDHFTSHHPTPGPTCQMSVKPGPGASMICHINLWRSSLDETKLHHFHR